MKPVRIMFDELHHYAKAKGWLLVFRSEYNFTFITCEGNVVNGGFTCDPVTDPQGAYQVVMGLNNGEK